MFAIVETTRARIPCRSSIRISSSTWNWLCRWSAHSTAISRSGLNIKFLMFGQFALCTATPFPRVT